MRNSPPRSSRLAFTLTEVLVAIVLIAISLTAFYIYAVAILRQFTVTRKETTAATLAHTRFEKILHGPCATSGGADTASGIISHWSTVSGPRTTQISITTSYKTLYTTKTESYSTIGSCR